MHINGKAARGKAGGLCRLDRNGVICRGMILNTSVFL